MRSDWQEINHAKRVRKQPKKMALFTSLADSGRPTCRSADSDVGHGAEELIIFRVSTFTLVDRLDVFDKLNGLYPLHHFEPEFVFRA